MNYTQQANQWLRRFRVDITSNSPRIFANGRQQVRVTVTLEPRDGQIISQDSLDSLQLILIDDDGRIRDLDAELAASTERDSRFTYHAGSGGAPSPLMEATTGTIRRHFYVTSTLPGGTLSTIYAGIWKDQDTSFETNRAPFLSSVEIESITPPPAHEELFKLSVQNYVYKVPSENYWDDEFDQQVGYFGFSNPARTIAQSIPHATPSAQPFYERHNWDHALISFHLTNDYSQQCRVTAYGVNEAFSLQLRDASQTLRQRPHHMTLHREHIRFYNRHRNALDEHTSSWSIIDNHGNAYQVEFFVEDGGRVMRFRVN